MYVLVLHLSLYHSRVGAGWNTSTVALRVPEGSEKGCRMRTCLKMNIKTIEAFNTANNTFRRSEILTVAKINSVVYWIKALCSLTGSYRRLGDILLFRHAGNRDRQSGKVVPGLGTIPTRWS
jgi:hypothetical protein